MVKLMTLSRARRAVLNVGDGRGFVAQHQNYIGVVERIILTAAHCIAHALRVDGKCGLPPCHPFRHSGEVTYPDLLGPLGEKPTIWATCPHVDPMTDIVVLWSPSANAFDEQSDACESFLENLERWQIADAPAQGRERIKVEPFGGEPFWQEQKTPGKGVASVLSLKGRWLRGEVTRSGNSMGFNT